MKGRHPCLPRPTGILLVDGITDGDKLEAWRPRSDPEWRMAGSLTFDRGQPRSGLLFRISSPRFDSIISNRRSAAFSISE
jgi:hypothetical protein